MPLSQLNAESLGMPVEISEIAAEGHAKMAGCSGIGCGFGGGLGRHDRKCGVHELRHERHENEKREEDLGGEHADRHRRKDAVGRRAENDDAGNHAGRGDEKREAGNGFAEP